MVNMFILLGLLEATSIISSTTPVEQDIQWLNNEPMEGHSGFKIYCYENVQKSLIYVWRSVYFEFEQLPSKSKLYTGENVAAVCQKYEEDTVLNLASWITWQARTVNFPAFDPYCVGISSEENFKFHLQTRTINYWKVLQTVIGVVLFFSALSLSRNSFFHYATGVSVGVLASVLILIFILTKLIPKKSASYAVLVFGFPFIIYLIQLLYYQLPNIISNYTDIFLAYAFFSAFVSFVVCYRLGPVENVRTFHTIQWSMQVLGLLLVFFSSEYKEVSTAFILVMLGIYFVPPSWIAKVKSLWYRYFPPKVKLLTETEYIEQGTVETKKSLENLRSFCNSPECKAWSVIRKLRDPIRFAKFIDGESHLTDTEILLYDSEALPDENYFHNEEETYNYNEESDDSLTENLFSSHIANGSAVR